MTQDPINSVSRSEPGPSPLLPVLLQGPLKRTFRVRRETAAVAPSPPLPDGSASARRSGSDPDGTEIPISGPHDPRLVAVASFEISNWFDVAENAAPSPGSDEIVVRVHEDGIMIALRQSGLSSTLTLARGQAERLAYMILGTAGVGVTGPREPAGAEILPQLGDDLETPSASQDVFPLFRLPISSSRAPVASAGAASPADPAPS